MTPALYRKMNPPITKTRIMPIVEVQTKSPAKHLRVYMKIKARTTAPPNAAKTHFQLLERSVVNELKSLELKVELKIDTYEVNTPLKTVVVGTQSRLIMDDV